MKTKERIKELLARLNDGVIEKEETIALALLSAVAGESIFLLGPPGVAKSLIARRLKYAFKDGTAFEYLMNRFSTPDEIFGPISISKLKNEDKYERIVKNYLPDATVVFLDEIWKAGPSIQNTLLTVLNEKIYRNGENEIKLPMKAIISASNELPTKGEGLEALWDRFLVRLFVEGIQDKENFNKMISESLKSYEDTIDAKLKISDDEYKVWDKKIDEIKIPENVFNVIQIIRARIEEENQKKNENENEGGKIYISDRRWRKIIRLLRTSAFLNDRDSVDLMDCFLIANCLWDELEQKQAGFHFVADAIEKHGYRFEIDLGSVKSEIEALQEEVEKVTNLSEKKLAIYTIQNTKFVRILGLNGRFNCPENDLITEAFFLNLKNDYLQGMRYRKDLGDRDTAFIKNGSFSHEVILRENQQNEGAFNLETKNITLHVTPKAPTKKQWDKRVSTFLTLIANCQKRMDIYKNKDLEGIKTNLFVDCKLANIVEKNLDDLKKEIEKLEIDLRKIKEGYESIEEQPESKAPKQLH